MNDLNLDMMDFTQLEIMKENKNSAITELTGWLNSHRPEHVLWAQKTAERIALLMELDAVVNELFSRMEQMYN
jgi:hypothetical protein